MVKRVLSEEELEQRREAGRRSAERRRRNGGTASDRLSRHQERQDTDPFYRAQTTDTIINQKLPLQLGTAGATLGGLAGLGLGYAVSPASGKFFPLQAKDNKNLVTRTMFSLMEGSGKAAGWAVGNLANEGMGALSTANRRFRELRGKGPGRFDWDPTARRAMVTRRASQAGGTLGRTLYNIYGTAKGVMTNAVHAATGRRRWLTGAVIGAPMALGLGGSAYGLGHWAGTSFAPYFPQEVRKSMNTRRLRKALDFAVSVPLRKELELEARRPGRPRGRTLSAEEIEQRREAARRSAEVRRQRAAQELGVSPDEVNSRGGIRVRTYTPRVRESGVGTFRSYNDQEAEFLREERMRDRIQAGEIAERNAYMDGDGKIRRGDGQFRQSRRTREERTFDRFLGETVAPGYGRHAAKVIGSVKEASDVSDPAAKYGIIGGGLGLAAGGILGSPGGRNAMASGFDYAYRRTVPRIQAAFHRGAQAVGLARPTSNQRLALTFMRPAIERVTEGRLGSANPLRERIAENIVRRRQGTGSWLARRMGQGLSRSFGSAMFLAPVIGSIGYGLGRRFGASLRDDDYRQDMINRQARDVERRAMLSGGR